MILRSDAADDDDDEKTKTLKGCVHLLYRIHLPFHHVRLDEYKERMNI